MKSAIGQGRFLRCFEVWFFEVFDIKGEIILVLILEQKLISGLKVKILGKENIQ